MNINNPSIDFKDPNYRYNYSIIKYIAFSSSLVSLLSTLFVFFMYSTRKSLHNLAFKLIVYLQVSDGIMAFSMLLEIFDPIDHDSLCKIQAFLGNYGCLSSFCWTCCISSSIYFASTGRWKKVEPYEKYFLIICFVVPFFISIFPLFFDYYGNSGYWCWVKIEDADRLIRDIFNVFILFLYLWFAMIYNSLLIFLTFQYFKKYENMCLLTRYDKHLKKTIMFPVAMVILWIIPSLYRVLQMIGYENFAFCCIHAICEGINGFINTMIYAFSKKFREEIRGSFSLNQENFLRGL